jgi:hypothetical protein
MSVDATLGKLTSRGLLVRAREDLIATLGRLIAQGAGASSADVAPSGRMICRGRAAETWYAVFESATGRLVSTGTALGELPPEQEAIELSGPPRDAEMWDEATRAFVSRPEKVVVDRADDVLAELEELGGRDRAAVRDAVTDAFPEELRLRPGG